MSESFLIEQINSLQVERVYLLTQLAECQRERKEARIVLVHTDIGSLPNDWTLLQIAEARLSDLFVLRDQVRDTCTRAEKAEAERDRLRATIEFYANPDTYFAIGIMPDPPCGEFMDDFSTHEGIGYSDGDQRPGKRAREALADAKP